jgi:hypothetical protein
MKVIKEMDQLKPGSTIYVILDWKMEGLKVVSETNKFCVFGLIIDSWRMDNISKYMVCHDVLNPGVKFEVDEHNDIYFRSANTAQEACDHMNGVEKKNTESVNSLKETAEFMEEALKSFSSILEEPIKKLANDERLKNMMPRELSQTEHDLIESLMKSVLRPNEN